MTDKTSCEYFVSRNMIALVSYAFKAGFWSVISTRKNPSSMSTRHFVPGAFVMFLLFSLAMFFLSTHKTGAAQLWLSRPLLILGLAYITGNLAAACHISVREKSLKALLVPTIFVPLHISYGAGTLSAILCNAGSSSFYLRRRSFLGRSPNPVEPQ